MLSPPHHKCQKFMEIANIVYQLTFFQAYLFCADDWRREEFLLSCGILWRPDTSLKTTQKMYSKTKLMTAQYFSSGHRSFYLPWMITHCWLVFVQNTMIITLKQSHSCHFKSYKNLWAVFLIPALIIVMQINSLSCSYHVLSIVFTAGRIKRHYKTHYCWQVQK